MTFTNLSVTNLIAGFAALAAITFLLQWIRIRHKQKKVATMLFWQKVLEQTRATTFWERFRHLWAYLLVLAICGLLWLAMSEPRTDTAQEGQFTVLLLDGSAVMTREGRFSKATDQLVRTVASLPSEKRQVYWVGGKTTNLLAPGESNLLLEKRLENHQPELTVSRVEKQIRHLAQLHSGSSGLNIVVFGDSPVRENFLSQLPDTVKVSRSLAMPENVTNSGITSLGLSRAASGDWFAVDLYFRVESNEEPTGTSLPFTVSLDGKDLDPSTILPLANGLKGSYSIADMPATGGIVEIRLNQKDTLESDNVSRIRLPKVEPIAVKVSDSLKDALTPILDADPAIKIVQKDEQVRIVDDSKSGGSKESAIPSLHFTAREKQQAAFVIGSVDSQSSDQKLVANMQSIGLDQIDAQQMADEATVPISVATEKTNQPSLRVWKELLSENFNFTRSRSFPIFISNSVRWLGRDKGVIPFAVVGQPLLNENLGRTVIAEDESGKAIQLLGESFIPTVSGSLKTDGPLVETGLVDRNLTLSNPAVSDSLEVRTAAGEIGGYLNWVTIILVGALIFVSAEWYLFQTGRMP